MNANKHMLPIVLVVCGGLAMSAVDLFAQGNRFGYHFYKKNDPSGNFRAYMDMCLDVSGTESIFYSESTFRRDSLMKLAINPKNGDVMDEEAYAEVTRIPSSTKDMTRVDYAKGTFIQDYQEATVFFSGSGTLELPEWTITDETEISCGYPSRKAEGDYMGRHWTIWFTEEIPLNAGPWLLWGAPGLIVYAIDSEELICFKLSYAEQLEDNHRADLLKSHYSSKNSRRKTFAYGIREIEKMHTRFMTDSDYLGQLTGSRLERIVDRNGRDITSSYQMKFIPMIPQSYWKD
ncbi:MAG: GLPGLI family protein [Bacteroidales bacterium]|nr:GLPGLI family protein [Bacteroidales bacterium]